MRQAEPRAASRRLVHARSLLAAGAAVVLLLCLPGLGVCRVSCSSVEGSPPRTTSLRIDIETPAGDVTLEPGDPCGQWLDVAGTFSVDPPRYDWDVYIVVDRSSSTTLDSGVDVDGDGVLGEPEDDAYHAELAASRAYVRALDPARSRVAIISFNRWASLEHALSPDLASVLATLDAMDAAAAEGITLYVEALQAIEREVRDRGDRASRVQRGVFLSDGIPSEGLDEILAAAAELAALGVAVDTYALRFPDSTALREIARVTDGTFTGLSTPGAIVALLPERTPRVTQALSLRNEITGEDGTLGVDGERGTFHGQVFVATGTNRVTVSLTTDGPESFTLECGVDVVVPGGLLAAAGDDLVVCEDPAALLVLDGSASETGTCQRPLYAWLDCEGRRVREPSRDPVVRLAEPGTCDTYRLELTCEGEGCASTDDVAVTWVATPELLPTALPLCGFASALSCGTREPSVGYEWDLDDTVDADGNGNPSDDADLRGCDVVGRWSHGGKYIATVHADDPRTGCLSRAQVIVTVAPLAPPYDLNGGVCPGETVSLSCGLAVAGLSYWWDTDTAVDADGDGDAGADADVLGCDGNVTWPDPGAHGIASWITDSLGCSSVLATGLVTVASDASPAEVANLRLRKADGGLEMTWGLGVGPRTFRVARGTLATLWRERRYDHASDSLDRRGACLVDGALSFVEDMASLQPSATYYLVLATSSCAGDGPTGHAWDGRVRIPRPGRQPTPSCPD